MAPSDDAFEGVKTRIARDTARRNLPASAFRADRPEIERSSGAADEADVAEDLAR
jgi:hypothetical protein